MISTAIIPSKTQDGMWICEGYEGRYYTKEMAVANAKCALAFDELRGWKPEEKKAKTGEIGLDNVVYRVIKGQCQLAGIAVIKREITRIQNTGGSFKISENKRGWRLHCLNGNGRRVSVWEIR